MELIKLWWLYAPLPLKKRGILNITIVAQMIAENRTQLHNPHQRFDVLKHAGLAPLAVLILNVQVSVVLASEEDIQQLGGAVLEHLWPLFVLDAVGALNNFFNHIRQLVREVTLPQKPRQRVRGCRYLRPVRSPCLN